VRALKISPGFADGSETWVKIPPAALVGGQRSQREQSRGSSTISSRSKNNADLMVLV